MNDQHFTTLGNWLVAPFRSIHPLVHLFQLIDCKHCFCGLTFISCYILIDGCLNLAVPCSTPYHHILAYLTKLTKLHVKLTPDQIKLHREPNRIKPKQICVVWLEYFVLSYLHFSPTILTDIKEASESKTSSAHS